MQRKANVFRLDPTPEQAALMARFAGATRFVYNLGLEQRLTFGRPGRGIGFAQQCRELTELRREVDWLAATPVHVLQQALRDVQRAYENFWAGRAEYPTPRKKFVNDTFRFPDPAQFEVRRYNRNRGAVKLPKLGWVRLVGWYDIPGEVRSITISRRAGHWYASVLWQREVEAPTPSTLPAVGIDRGVTVFAALSDGTLLAPANAGARAQRGLARAQRRLARKRKGSNRWRKQKSRIAKLNRRIANTRRDFVEKASLTIAQNHGVVVIENLKIKNMVRSAKGTREKPGRNVRAKAGLNRSILDQGWGMFAAALDRKLAERGGRLERVEPRNTSRECHVCGVVDPASRASRDLFRCTACGHSEHADINAARVILGRWGTPSVIMPVEGSRQAPDEAGTARRAA